MAAAECACQGSPQNAARHARPTAINPDEQTVAEQEVSAVAAVGSWESCFPALALAMPGGNESFNARALFPGASAQEFQPTLSPRGLSPPPLSSVGPGANRLLLAVSPDGRTWTKTGEIVANYADVPALAVEDGVLYLFFNVVRQGCFDASGTALGPDPNQRNTPLAVAWTTDLVHWTYRLLGDQGAGLQYTRTFPAAAGSSEYYYQAMDPCVVRAKAPATAGDHWFLYFTLALDTQGTGPMYASYIAGAARLSDFQWTQRNNGNQVFPDPTTTHEAKDPNVLWIDTGGGGGYYQYYAGGEEDPATGYQTGRNWTCSFQADGTTRITTSDDVITVPCQGDYSMMSNGMDFARPSTGRHGWHAFVNDPSGNYIIATTLDAAGNFVAGTDATSCVPLLVRDRSYEQGGVKDATVVRFRGCYVMVYVSGIPTAAYPGRSESVVLAPGAMGSNPWGSDGDFGRFEPPGGSRHPAPDPDLFVSPTFEPPSWLTDQPLRADAFVVPPDLDPILRPGQHPSGPLLRPNWRPR
jgi:hypothetical protein